MKAFKSALVGGLLVLSSSSAMAATVNGITWDPNSSFDFGAQGTVYEQFALAVGQTVQGFGKVNLFNNESSNVFGPNTELTFSFGFKLASANFFDSDFDLIPDSWGFNFNEGFFNMYTGTGANKNFNLLDETSITMANATDGELFLSSNLVLNSLGRGLAGTATDLFDISLISGTGTGFLDITGGAAASYFVNDFFNLGGNTKADLKLQSSFGTTTAFTPTGFPLLGSATLSGATVNDVPEPASIALLGIGLIGLAFGSVRTTNKLAA